MLLPSVLVPVNISDSFSSFSQIPLGLHGFWSRRIWEEEPCGLRDGGCCSSLHFASTASSNELLFLSHPQFSAVPTLLLSALMPGTARQGYV